MSSLFRLATVLAFAPAQGSGSEALGGCADGEEEVGGKCEVVFDVYTQELADWTRIEIFGRNQTYWEGPLKRSLLSVVSTQDFAEASWASLSSSKPLETIVIRTMRCADLATLNTSWEARASNEDLGLARWSMYNTSLAGQMCGDYGSALEIYHTKVNVTHFLQSSFTNNRYAPSRHHTLEECFSFGVQIPETINFVIWLSQPHNASLSGDENFELYGIQTLSRLPPLNYTCLNESMSTGMGMSNVVLSKSLSDVIKSGECAVHSVLSPPSQMSSQSVHMNASIII